MTELLGFDNLWVFHEDGFYLFSEFQQLYFLTLKVDDFQLGSNPDAYSALRENLDVLLQGNHLLLFVLVKLQGKYRKPILILDVFELKVFSRVRHNQTCINVVRSFIIWKLLLWKKLFVLISLCRFVMNWIHRPWDSVPDLVWTVIIDNSSQVIEMYCRFENSHFCISFS